MTYDEYDDKTDTLKDFKYTEEDIEAIFSNIESVNYDETIDTDIEWEDLELDRINYHISKQRAKGKVVNEIKEETDKQSGVLQLCKEWINKVRK